MAEIPVERKSGMPWWVWALLALLALLALIWIFSDDDEAERAAVDGTGPVVADQVAVNPNEAAIEPATEGAVNQAGIGQQADGQAGSGPITDLSTITGTNDIRTLAGREVQLSNVTVQDVVGDRTFWVGSSADQRAFIVLNEQPTPNRPGVEGRYNVTKGQIINVNGVVRNTNDLAFGGQPIQGLPSGQQAVVHAQSLDILQRP